MQHSFWCNGSLPAAKCSQSCTAVINISGYEALGAFWFYGRGYVAIRFAVVFWDKGAFLNATVVRQDFGAADLLFAFEIQERRRCL